MQRFKFIFAIGLALLFFENSSPGAPPTNLVFGSTISGTIGEPGEEDAFTFAGTLGQRLYYDALDTDFAPIQVRLVGPDGAVVYVNGNSDNDVGPFSLVEAGQYTLIISGSGSTAGDYSFRLDDVAAAAPLSLGATISGDLGPRSETDLYQFTGKLGQRLHFTSVSASASQANWQLVGPADQILVTRNITTDLGDVVLPANGVYVVLVEGAAANTVPLTYQFSVSDASEPVVAVSGLGAVVAGSINAGQRLTNTFTAPAGTLVYFDNLDRNNSAVVVEVRDPANAQVFFIGTTADSGPYFLSRSGTYSLIIGGADQNSSGAYRFRLIDLASTAVSLTLNSKVSQTLNPAWKTDVYQFTGTAGQRLYFDALDDDADVIQAVLVGPTGSIVHMNQRSQNDVGPFTLAASGTYFLFLVGNQAGTSNYSFQLWDVAGQPALNLNVDQSGSLVPGNSVRIFKFTGVDQQRLFFDGKGTNNGGFGNLYGPGNEAIASANLINDFEVTLSRNGEYILVLDGASPNPVPYSFRLSTPKTTTNALTLGTLVTGTLAEPGEEQWYAFNGTPGQRLYYDAWDADFDAISARLVSPSGVSVNINGNADSDVGPFTLAEDGVYNLVLNGNGATTGDYRFRLIDVDQPPAKPLILDTTVGIGLVFVPASALNLTGSYVNKSLRDYATIDDWRSSQTIAGTRTDTNINFPSDGWGQRAGVGITGGTDANWQNFSVQWDGQITITVDGTHLYTRSDDGSRMWIDLNNDGAFEDTGPEFINNNWGTGQGATTGPASVALAPGTYRVRIQYEQGAGAAEMYLLWDGGVSLDPGTRAEIFRFNGVAGQQLFFDGLGPATGGNWSLIGPGNQSLGSANLVNDFEVTLPLTGTYLLVLDGASPNPIPYSFRVNSFQTQTQPLTLGTTVNGIISNPGEQDWYTFRGTAGQRLYYDALQGDFDAIAVRLVSPSGTVVNINGNSDSDVGPFTLVEDGNYTLILDGNGSTTGDYSFRLVDVDQAPAKPLTLDTTVGIGLVPIPTNALNLTGSYVNKSLRDYATNDDWRISQTIAGTRIDAAIDFPTDGWGQRATLGITSGTDANWQNFSVQWDGQITITTDNTHLYTRSDDGSRMWIDLNNDGVFEDSGPEFVNNNWGNAQGATTGPGSVGLPAGTYHIRVQYEQGTGAGEMSLLWDGGISLDPGMLAEIFRFQGTVGQQLFFDGLGPNSGGNWILFAPGNQAIGSANLVGDFEVTLPQTGVYLLILSGNSAASVPYSFRVVPFGSVTQPLTLGSAVNGAIAEPGEQARFTFRGTPGQRLYYDALEGDFDPIGAHLVSPSGLTVHINGNSDSDFGPFTLVEDGLYTLVIDGNGATTGNYAFRLLEVSKQPVLPFDVVQTGILDPGFSSLIFRLDGANARRLFYDGMGANSRGNATLYGPANEFVASANLINDFIALPDRNGEYVLVLNGNSEDPVPYSFKMTTPNDNNVAPTISDVPDQSTPVNVALPPITFSVGDVETAPANLLVSARTSNPLLVPGANITFGGSGSSRTVSIVPATNQFGSALITLSVKDASGAEASDQFVLTVVPVPPRIVQQPLSQTAAIGGSVTFSVVADGTGPFVYQWRLNGLSLPGATDAALTLANVQPGDAGSYAVAVGTPFGAVNSDVATLQVTVNPLPLANDFAGRTNVTETTRLGGGSNVGATKEAGEPNHAGKVGGKSVWLDWTPPVNGIATFSTRGSSFDTLLAVYLGSTLASLTPVVSDDDRGSFFTSRVTFNADAGTTYHIAVDGLAGAEGRIILSWNLEATTETLPQITIQPTNQTVSLGNSIAFNVTAQGTNLRYQWFFNGVAMPGATVSSLTLLNVQLTDVGTYLVRVSSGTRFVDSLPATLQINTTDGGAAAPVKSDDKFADLVSGAASPLATQSVPLLARGKKGLLAVARGFSGTQIFSTIGSTKEQGEPNHCGIIGGASQWFAYQAPTNGTLVIDTDGSDFDTVLAVYTGPGTDFASLNSVACDNDSGSDGRTSRVSLPATAGTTYYVAVDGVDAATGNVQLNYALSLVPTTLRLTVTETAASGFRINVTGSSAGNCTLQGSTNLIDWTVLLTTNAPAGNFEFQDANASGLGQRFYRALSAQ